MWKRHSPCLMSWQHIKDIIKGRKLSSVTNLTRHSDSLVNWQDARDPTQERSLSSVACVTRHSTGRMSCQHTRDIIQGPMHRGSLPTEAQTGERFSGWLGCSKNKKNIFYTKIVKWNLLQIGKKKIYDFFQIFYMKIYQNKAIFCFGFWALGCTKKTKKNKKMVL